MGDEIATTIRQAPGAEHDVVVVAISTLQHVIEAQIGFGKGATVVTQVFRFARKGRVIPKAAIDDGVPRRSKTGFDIVNNVDDLTLNGTVATYIFTFPKTPQFIGSFTVGISSVNNFIRKTQHWIGITIVS